MRAWGRFVWVGLVLATGLGARAQEVAAAVVTGAQVPVRAVRLTFVAGAVSVERSDNTAEDAPVLNMALYEGTRLVTGDYGQAEIEFEDGSVVRLTPRSAVSLDALALEGGAARSTMTLLSGMAYFELRKSAGSAFRVNVGGVAVAPAENGVVRAAVGEQATTFAVLAGSAVVAKDKGFSATVRAGESLRVDARDDSRYFLSDNVEEQNWDRWNEERDEQAVDDADARTSARDGFAGAQGYGWADLDANGSWYNLPGEGPVWQPNVADDQFDPYGYGAWTWGTMSYVWASGYSWGWTPFRCGRWRYSNGFGWGWVPDSSCGSWGYGGGGAGWGGVRIGRAPGRYGPVRIPQPGAPGNPIHVHPIVTVHGPDGMRPPVRRGGPITIAGKSIEPLGRVGVHGPRGGGAVGQGLQRDAPVDRRTGKPVTGVVAGSGSSPASPLDGTVMGWRSVAAPVRTGSGAGNRNERGTGAASPGLPVRATPVSGSPVAAPVVPAPVRTGPVPAPVSAAAPVRANPAPAPAPVHVAPAPAPAPAPARAEPATPKPKG